MSIIKNLTEIKYDSSIKGIIFDCFGTLLEIKNQHKPYKYLYSELEKNGFKSIDYARWVMSENLSLDEIQKKTNIILTKEVKENFLLKIKKELDSIELFDETESVIKTLRENNLKVALCSNLATPYGYAKKILPELDYYYLSYELGMIKPDQELLTYAQKEMGLKKEEIIFVGDSERDDYYGAKEYGFQAYLLKREKNE